MNINTGPILVVEDIPNLLQLLEVTLRFKGYPVVGARNGREALEFIERERPALVITDILMPEVDGYALAYTLRNDPRTSQIPLIFISATYITPDDKNFALKLGAVRFIEKPIDTEDFLLTVAEILTDGVASLPRPMEEVTFYQGYRERLENKLRYKQNQIARTERLLNTLPDEQKPAFEDLLRQSIEERDRIKEELDRLYAALEELRNTGTIDDKLF
jgi:CheY-like chemotaxis protein